MKNQVTLRLHSDHHHLVLERFDAKNKLWQSMGDILLEYVTESRLVEWLQSFASLKNAKCALLLSEDCFKWQNFNLQEKVLASSLEFLEMAKQEVVWEPNFLVDANNCQVVMLEQATVQPYLMAFKICKIKLARITSVGAPELNLLPWREHQAQKAKRRKVLGLGILPVLALSLAFGIAHWQEALLQKAQNQNHQLIKQLSGLTREQSALTLSQILPLIKELLQYPELLNVAIKIDGSVYIKGFANSNTAVNTALRALGALPELAPKSMHDLSVQHGSQGQSWSVNFELQGTGS